MKIKKKLYRKFLLSNRSNFISYAISKIHLTYHEFSKNENFNPFSSLIKKIFYLFDDDNLYQKKNTTTDVAIISNVVSVKKINNDIYFGNLAKLLKKDKIKTISVYRNHTSNRSKLIKQLLKRNVILLSKRLNIIKEILIVLFFLKELCLYIFSKKYSFIKRFLNIKDLLSIISNLRLYYQLDKVLKFYRPKVVIFTYEGHAWERLLVFLCKNYELKIQSIAYQFSVIKKNQIGFFNKLKQEYNPDYIATTGEIPHNIIKKKINFSKLLKLGSSKFEKQKKLYNKKIDLLVSLDSNKNTLFEVLEFCINFSLINPKYKIILRPHPILINDLHLLNTILKMIEKTQNIKLSRNSLNNDLKKSRYLLYTESVICITGLNFSVTPLFYKYKNIKNMLDGNFPKKNIIKNYSDLHIQLKDKKDKKISNYFKNYRDNYFEKYQIKNLKKIIKNSRDEKIYSSNL